MNAPTVTTPTTETTPRRFTVAERMQVHRARGLGEETEADRYAWIADANALIREHLTYLKVRSGRIPGDYLQIHDWWPLVPWEDTHQETHDRTAALFGYLAAGGGVHVLERTLQQLGSHIEKAALAGDQERLLTARRALVLLGRTLGDALGASMCERRDDGGGLRLAEWAQQVAAAERAQRERNRAAMARYEAERKTRQREQLAAARDKAAAKRRARRAAARAALEAEAGIPALAGEADA